MVNQLGMAEQHSILTLWRRGWSYRRIAQTLGIHRETVSRYVRLASEQTQEAHGPPALFFGLQGPQTPRVAEGLPGRSCTPQRSRSPAA